MLTQDEHYELTQVKQRLAYKVIKIADHYERSKFLTILYQLGYLLDENEKKEARQ